MQGCVECHSFEKLSRQMCSDCSIMNSDCGHPYLVSGVSYIVKHKICLLINLLGTLHSIIIRQHGDGLRNKPVQACCNLCLCGMPALWGIQATDGQTLFIQSDLEDKQERLRLKEEAA